MLVDSRQCIQEFIHIPIKLFNTLIDRTRNVHSVTLDKTVSGLSYSVCYMHCLNNASSQGKKGFVQIREKEGGLYSCQGKRFFVQVKERSEDTML